MVSVTTSTHTSSCGKSRKQKAESRKQDPSTKIQDYPREPTPKASRIPARGNAPLRLTLGDHAADPVISLTSSGGEGAMLSIKVNGRGATPLGKWANYD